MLYIQALFVLFIEFCFDSYFKRGNSTYENINVQNNLVVKFEVFVALAVKTPRDFGCDVS
jgi:hypothetical protein